MQLVAGGKCLFLVPRHFQVPALSDFGVLFMVQYMRVLRQGPFWDRCSYGVVLKMF